MFTESIKLSPKKNGKGYVSSYSVSISNKEAQECGMIGNRLIKIIDSNRAEIIIKAKRLTVTIEMLKQLERLKEQEQEESKQIFIAYSSDGVTMSMLGAMERLLDCQSGKIKTPAFDQLEEFLLSLTMENIIDLVLLMYMGRDLDCDMDINPGEERFLEFYERKDYLANGKSKEELVGIILEKTPLMIYLRTAYRLLKAPKGTSIDTFFHDWNEM